MRARLIISLALSLTMIGSALSREFDTPPIRYTEYPAFRGNDSRVEAITVKGLMQELIIGCDDGAGILTYSKVEGLYCTPDHWCTQQLQSAVQRLC